MYNRIDKHLKSNNLLFDKKIGGQLNTSTEHTILQLVNNICSCFEREEYILRIFINFF